MTTITALPTPPSRSTDDAATFSSKADTFVAALQTFGAEANLVADETNAASAGALAASAAATAVVGAAKWAGTTASYTQGNAVWSGVNFKTYRLRIASKSANVANTDPSIDTASWALVNGTGDVIATSAQTLTNKTLSNALGAAALPSYGFTGDLNTGAWSPGADAYSISTGGVERMRIDSSGNVLVGTTAANGKLSVTDANSGTATFSTYIKSGVSTNHLLAIRSDGYVSMEYTYNSVTSASAANLVIGSGGFLYRSTSSQRYKRNIVDSPRGLAEVLKLRSVNYQGRAANDGGTVFGGLIAEEVHAAGLTEFVSYNEAGEPDALHYGHMVALLAKAMQEQQVMITALTERVAALEA